MKTLTRKQRELQEREARILEVSREVVVREGYHGLSMDRVAEALEYSKGTIYNHFSCKEDIILALAVQTTEKRTELFERAAAFRGRARERFLAIGVAAELFFRLYPDHFKLEQIIRSASIWEKTSEERRGVMRMCESRCTSIVGGVMRDAISQGDLTLPDGTCVEDFVFGVWSMAYGAFSIIATSDQLTQLGIADPFAAFRLNVTQLIDGLGWRPLSADYDFNATMDRIQSEVFRDEIHAVGP